MSAPRYGRIVLKASGEILAGDRGFGFEPAVLDRIAEEIAEVHTMGVETVVVLGGGNIFRGMPGAARGVERVTGDNMGMIATVINALALQDRLEHIGKATRVMSAVEMPQFCEPYIRRRAERHLEKGRVVIFAAGTGNPFFTTDTAASLRAVEIGADILFKATKVDGVYDSDPMANPDAKRYSELTYLDVLSQKLKVMDSTAISLCMDNDLPVLVFNMLEVGNLGKAVRGDSIGTIVRGSGTS